MDEPIMLSLIVTVAVVLTLSWLVLTAMSITALMFSLVDRVIELRERWWLRAHNYRYGVVLPACWLGGLFLLFLANEYKSPTLATLTSCVAVYIYHLGTKGLR